MAQQIQNRRGTAAAWTSANPILAEGEIGIEIDTRKTKYGDGVTAWTSLAYSAGAEASADAGKANVDGDNITAPEDWRKNLKIDTGIASPNFAAQLHKLRTTANGHQVSVLALGDSLGTRVTTRLFPALKDKYPIAGYALDELSTLVASGTVVVPGANATTNYQPTMWDSGRVWNMSSGAVLSVGMPLGGAGYREFRASRITVWASKQVGGGTLTIAYQRDGSTWNDIGTLDTNGTALEVAQVTLNLPTNYWAKFRITSSVGPVNYIGAKIWDHTANGLILASSTNGGTKYSQANQGSASVRGQIGTDLGNGIILTHYWEGDGDATQSDINTFLDNWRTAMPASDALVYEQVGAYDLATEDEINDLYSVAKSTRPWVRTAPVRDWLRGLDYVAEQAFDDPDNVHLDDDVWRAVAARVYDELFVPSVPGPQWVQQFLTGNTTDFFLGNPVAPSSFALGYKLPYDRASGGSMGMASRSASGNEAGFMLRALSSASAVPLGVRLEIATDTGFRTPITFDGIGYTYFGPYNATPQSAYTLGARLYVDEDDATKAGMTVRHTNASATTIFNVEDDAGTEVLNVNRDGVDIIGDLSVTGSITGISLVQNTGYATLTINGTTVYIPTVTPS